MRARTVNEDFKDIFKSKSKEQGLSDFYSQWNVPKDKRTEFIESISFYREMIARDINYKRNYSNLNLPVAKEVAEEYLSERRWMPDTDEFNSWKTAMKKWINSEVNNETIEREIWNFFRVVDNLDDEIDALLIRSKLM